MKRYLAIFLGSTDPAQESADENFDEKAFMSAWATWAQTHDAAIVDGGTPLGKTKRIVAAGIADTKNNMVVYTIVQAASHDDAARIFIDHPHVVYFPGTSIEIMECLEVPKM